MYPQTVVVGPVTSVVSMCGVEDFLIYTLDDEETIQNALKMVTETAVEAIKMLAKQGAKMILIADPSLSLVTPPFFEKCVLPLYKKIFTCLKELGMYSRLHVCGNINAILPLLVGCGTNVLDADHPVVLENAKQITKALEDYAKR